MSTGYLLTQLSKRLGELGTLAGNFRTSDTEMGERPRRCSSRSGREPECWCQGLSSDGGLEPRKWLLLRARQAGGQEAARVPGHTDTLSKVCGVVSGFPAVSSQRNDE